MTGMSSASVFREQDHPRQAAGRFAGKPAVPPSGGLGEQASPGEVTVPAAGRVVLSTGRAWLRPSVPVPEWLDGEPDVSYEQDSDRHGFTLGVTVSYRGRERSFLVWRDGESGDRYDTMQPGFNSDGEPNPWDGRPDSAEMSGQLDEWAQTVFDRAESLRAQAEATVMGGETGRAVLRLAVGAEYTPPTPHPTPEPWWVRDARRTMRDPTASRGDLYAALKEMLADHPGGPE